MNISIMSFLTSLMYSFALLVQWQHLRGKWVFPKTLFITYGTMASAFHAYLLYHWINTPFGQNLSPSHMFSLITWLITTLTFFLALFKPIETLSIFILPLTIFSIPLAFSFPGQTFLQTQTHPEQLTHVLISIAALGILGMATLQATLLYLQHLAIRNKQSEGVVRFLPPLQTMETLLFQIIWLGFLFLSASLLSAYLFLEDMFTLEHFQKVFFSFLAWGFFATLLYGHHRSGWRGTTAVRWTLSGMMFLIIAYFSSKLILFKYWN
jgi:ABC-type uncharacterized transport system permease subunit